MSQLTKFFLLFASLLFNNNLFSQEQLGLRLGNYSGINGVTLNPAAGVNNPLGWNVNVVSFSSFVANDFAFIRDARVSSFLLNLSTLGPAPETKITVPTKSTQFIDFFNRPRDKFFSMSHFLSLPSFQVSLENGHSFGLFWGQRVAVVTRDIPIIADPYVQKDITLGTLNKVPPLIITGMTWGELGFNYAYQLGDETERGLSFGVNVKLLRGNQGFFVQNFEGTSVTRLTKDSTRVDAVNVKVGFTNNFTDKILSNNGLGLGVDIGAQFVLGSGESDDKPYLFRLSASLLDLGHVNFSKNTDVHTLKLTEPLKIDTKDYLNLDPKDPEGDALRRFNQKTFGKADSSLQGHFFSMGLPSAFSLQGDLALNENFFLNGLIIQRLSMSNYTISRDNLLALTPRFEAQRWGASLPLSFLNYRQVRLGLAARLAFLTIGTDHLLSFLGQKELSGSDFYLSFKINPLTLGKFGSDGGFGRGRSGGKDVKCYRF